MHSSLGGLLRSCSYRLLQSAQRTEMTASVAPIRLTLPGCGRTVRVDQLRTENLQNDDEAFQLVRDAAQAGNNVGIDEYPTSRHFKDFLCKSTTALGLWEDNTGHLDGIVVVSPCIYARSCRPILCSAVVITSSRLDHRGWHDAVDVAMETTRRLPEVYSACVMNVFVPCVEHVLAARQAGFMITGCIPHAGRVAGVPGYVDNYLMYMDLGNQPRQPILSDKVDAEENDSTESYYRPRLLRLPQLPVTRTLRDGTKITLRNMRHEDIKAFYDIVRSSADAGWGYGSDELPNLSEFTRCYLDDYYTSVAELAESGETIGFMNRGPSIYSRSADPVIMDAGNMGLVAKFCGKRWSVEIQAIFAELVDLHLPQIRGAQSDLACTNLTAYNMAMKSGYMVNGVLPRGIHLKGKGWVDMVLVYKPTHLPQDSSNLLSRM